MTNLFHKEMRQNRKTIFEVNSEESDIAGATSDVDSDEDYEFIAKSGREVPYPRLLAVASVTLSRDFPGQRAQLILQPQCTTF
jgi:hypothetical protein